MEKNELMRVNAPAGGGLVLDAPFRERMKLFTEALSQAPLANEVKQHPALKQERKGADGKVERVPVDFIPIGIIERNLDYYFYGMWETYDFKYTVVVNEIVGDLILRVYNPDAGVWLRRVGTGAVVIQQRARDDNGEKLAPDVTDISRKIANTLVKDMGHLKAECLKNAAKSLGGLFGRGLNRENEDVSYVDNIVTPEMVEQEIKDIETLAELKLYIDTLPDTTYNDKRAQQAIAVKRTQLKATSK